MGATLSATLTSEYFRVVQVSYGSDTPLLSNIEDFPMFYRTVPSYLSYFNAVAAVMQHFDWQMVGVIHEEVPYYTVALETLNAYLSSSSTVHGASITNVQGLTSFLDLQMLLGSARIFIVMAPESMAAAVLCSAFHLELTGPLYQWILLGDFDEDWWKQTPKMISTRQLRASCSEDVMLKAIESTIILTYNLITQTPTDEIVSGQTMLEFWSDFAIFFNETEKQQFNCDLTQRVASTYDAVWSIALALNKSLTTYPDQFMTGNLSEPQEPMDGGLGFSIGLNSAMETLDFQGASGRTVFTANQHSQLPPVTHISQMQNGSIVFIGIYDERGRILNLSGSLSWQSATGPPRDRPNVQLETVHLYLVVIMLFIMSLGIILCIVLAVINCYYRKHKVIKASSPYINILIISGCFMGFVSVIFISIENIDAYLTINPKAYIFLCNARPWLLSIGYTLAFGALIAKTWRIYCIFKNPWRRKRPLKDHVLIGMVCILLAVDVVLLVLWLVLDPLNLHAFIIDTGDETFAQELHLLCSDSDQLDISRSGFTIWVVILMVLKGILLLFGFFLVSRTGKIKAVVFQDAKYSGIAIYGVGVVCSIGVPVALFLMYNFVEDPGYIISTATISFCSYLILFMVFIPKIILLKKYKKKVPTAVLIGLNPSFRVQHNSKYLKNKYRQKLQINPQQDTNVLQSRGSHMENVSNITVLTSANDSQSNVGLVPSSLKKEDDFSDLLEGWETSWEPSVEGHGMEHSILNVHETEISFGDISYIASIVIENEPDGSLSMSLDQMNNEPNIELEGESHMTTSKQDRPEAEITTLEASKSSFSIDYTTVCGCRGSLG